MTCANSVLPTYIGDPRGIGPESVADARVCVQVDTTQNVANILGLSDLVAELRKRAQEIRALGATSLYLFGSTARGEANENSDFDLFIDYDPEKFRFVEPIRLREHLSKALGHPADLTTRDGLHPLLRPSIEAEAIKVF